MLAWLGVRVRVEGERTATPGACLQTPNHVSDLDILVVQSVRPTVFVASREVAQSLFLGLLARAGGTLFVERRQKSESKQDASQIKNILSQGLCVTLFPEGTTTAGETVLPFKSSLFEAAMLESCPVQPVQLRYRTIDGRPVTKQNRDQIYYYGDMSFWPHLWRMCSVRSVEVTFSCRITLSPKLFRNRKDLSREAHRWVCA